MSSSKRFYLHLWWTILAILLLDNHHQSYGLNLDGVLLLSFKYSILSDPLGKFVNWSLRDYTPCSWNGVTCGTTPEALNRVIGLALPNSQLLGSIPANLGMIQHLKYLDLSNNSINGSIPFSIFRASELQNLDISNNMISGELPDFVGGLKNLQFLNLSDNALSGKIPENLTSLRNLTIISLKNNYFFGTIPGGFDSVQVLELSSNLINGSLPPNFGGSNLSYLNVSFNRISGKIPQEFAINIPPNATIDLSFNNLTGEIPKTSVFSNQDSKSFAGNQELCGRPLINICPIPSTISTSPNDSEPTSRPAIAAIPKTIDSSPAYTSGSAPVSPQQSNGLKPIIIAAIVVASVALVTFFALVIVCIRQSKKKNRRRGNIKKEAEHAKEFDWAASSSASSEEYNWLRTWTCLKKSRYADAEETSSESTNTESESNQEMRKSQVNQVQQDNQQKKGELVTLNGERELELETLLKASAYILGASGSSIMYKAVLEDGTALAVRRIGESGLERFRDFENQVRVIAKLVHPNLVRTRGFYWGADEKLIIYDFVPNGSLANARYRKAGASPCHLPWAMRLKIATGVARGLNYIHDKKHVHGNLKPSNILLGMDMEPKIGDFGLERLINSSKASGSARNFGSKRSNASRESFQDVGVGPTPSLSPSAFSVSPYHAPEYLRSLKPNPKWDVFSFGVVLLELLSGKVIVSDEMFGGSTLDVEVLRMADVAIRADVEGKEDAFLSLVKLGYNCVSPLPQKRPTIKHLLHALDNFPSSSSTSFY